MGTRARRVGLVVIGLVMAGLLAAACGAGGPARRAGTDSGISGETLAGPVCPVQTADRPCPPRPVSVRILVSNSSGAGSTTFTSDRAGRFRLALPAGTYTLRTSNTPGPRLTPEQVTVTAGHYTELRLVLDTGIR